MSNMFIGALIKAIKDSKFELYNPYPQEKYLELNNEFGYIVIDLLALEMPYSVLTPYIEYDRRGKNLIYIEEEEYRLLREAVAEFANMPNQHEDILEILNFNCVNDE